MSELPVGEVICGDALEVMRGFEAGAFSAVVTDPPYGTGERLRVDGEFVTTKAEWDLWDPSWIALAKDTPCAMFCSAQKAGGFLSAGWRLFAWCSANPPAKGGLHPRRGIQPIVARGPFREEFGLDWFYHRSNIQTPQHPHEKPLPVMRWLIETMTEPNALVLDPFCGSGTTLVACVQTGRRFIGIDISEDYCAIARRRVAEALLQPRLDFGDAREKPMQEALL